MKRTLALALLLAATMAAGQAHPFARFAVATSGGLGYTNPGYLAGVGLDVEHGALLARAACDANTADKIETHDGTGVLCSGRAGFHRNGWLAGAGIEYSHVTTHAWSKSATRATVHGGYASPNVLFLATVAIPAGDAHNHQWKEEMDLELRTRGRLWIVGGISTAQFRPTDQATAPYQGGVEARLGLMWRW